MSVVTQMAKRLVHRFGRWYIRLMVEEEYQSSTFRCINERPVEYSFLFRQLARFFPKAVLDVGTGMTALPHLLRTCGCLVTAVDNIRDYWLPGDHFNRHFHVVDDDICSSRLAGTFDFITCISVLEHLDHPEAAVRSMCKLLNTGGHLVLTFPYNETTFVENVYSCPEAGYGKDEPYKCAVYSRTQLDQWVSANNTRICEQEYWKCFTGKMWTFGERLAPVKLAPQEQEHDLTCVLLEKNPSV